MECYSSAKFNCPEVVLVFGVMAFATPGGRPSPASMLGGPAAGHGLLFTGYVPYQPTCAGQVAPASRSICTCRLRS